MDNFEVENICVRSHESSKRLSQESRFPFPADRGGQGGVGE
jgi:hypothetical protein